MMQKYRKYFII